MLNFFAYIIIYDKPKKLKLGKFCKPKINVRRALSGSDTACMVYLVCFISKMFLFPKWFNGSIFLSLFYPLFSGIHLKHYVTHSNIRAFKYNGEFQLLQKTLKEYFHKPQEYFCRLEVVWKFGFSLIQMVDSKLFTLLKL